MPCPPCITPKLTPAALRIFTTERAMAWLRLSYDAEQPTQ